MRPDDDYKTPNYELYWKMIRQYGYSSQNVFCIFEDHARSVALYRRLGFLTLQVQSNPTLDQLVVGSREAVSHFARKLAHRST
jgi:hypothetical protein